jgi:hypothetical protein
VFLYATSCIAFAASIGSVRPVTWSALGLVSWYTFAWSVTPTILRLAEARPFTLAAVTISSCAVVVAGIVFFTHFRLSPRQQFTSAMALFSLGAIAVAGVAVWIS